MEPTSIDNSLLLIAHKEETARQCVTHYLRLLVKVNRLMNDFMLISRLNCIHSIEMEIIHSPEYRIANTDQNDKL
jgi:hypothetical protein